MRTRRWPCPAGRCRRRPGCGPSRLAETWRTGRETTRRDQHEVRGGTGDRPASEGSRGRGGRCLQPRAHRVHRRRGDRPHGGTPHGRTCSIRGHRRCARRGPLRLGSREHADDAGAIRGGGRALSRTCWTDSSGWATCSTPRWPPRAWRGRPIAQGDREEGAAMAIRGLVEQRIGPGTRQPPPFRLQEAAMVGVDSAASRGGRRC